MRYCPSGRLLRHKCARLLRQFREEGRSLFFVSHDPNAVKTFCDYAILLDRGMVVREGVPSDVLDYYNALIAAKEREHEIRVTETTGGQRQTRSGNGRATLERFDLLDAAGRSVRAVLCGATVRIACAVEFRQNVAAPTVGFLIRDRLGNDVFGTNTLNLGLATRTYAAGESMEVAFSLPANLGPATTPSPWRSTQVRITARGTMTGVTTCWRSPSCRTGHSPLPALPHWAPRSRYPIKSGCSRATASGTNRLTSLIPAMPSVFRLAAGAFRNEAIVGPKAGNRAWRFASLPGAAPG